jgi:hypothetical protein
MEQVTAPDTIGGLIDSIDQTQSESGFRKIAERWGVRRSNPQFWFYFNDLTAYQRETAPLEAGAMDMSRFENL